MSKNRLATNDAASGKPEPKGSLPLSVLIPAYNEETLIQANLREVLTVLDRSFDSYEVIVLDDASQDETYTQAMKVATDDPRVKIIRASENNGKGHALRLAFESCCGREIVFLDADLDLPPEQIEGFINQLRASGVDAVVGSKHHPDSHITYPESRRLLSRLYAFTVRILFGLPIRDTQTGLKVFNREVLEYAFPRMKCERFAFDLEILALAHQKGFKIAERPVVLRFQRKVRFGRIRSRDFLVTAWDTFTILLRVKCLNRFSH